ncbi:uncharacterized protein KGF55_004948 [Candida pseudojiufengensis]|uniref:uncharacterized protein n=1 Tax=Candida pseudojiufengensis TaxID=497109 RepID=UPI002225B475|nr:uncharacterized protein KGF55_004948 [Candida pseudojiufengensis]KAI5959716.1 hypothetical protein KGF55_004948 [Candida pseudojiufengensis]
MMAFDYLASSLNNKINNDQDKSTEIKDINFKNSDLKSKFNISTNDENTDIRSNYLDIPLQMNQFSNLDQLSSSQFQNLSLNSPRDNNRNYSLNQKIPTSINQSMWNNSNNLSLNSNQYQQHPQRGLYIDSSNIWSQKQSNSISEQPVSTNIWSPPSTNSACNPPKISSPKFLQQNNNQQQNNLNNANANYNLNLNTSLINNNYTSSNTNANNRTFSITEIAPTLDEINNGINGDYVNGGSLSPQTKYDIIRRRSYTDNLSNDTATAPVQQQQLYQETNSTVNLNDANIMKMVDEYFETDPHERVKVTMQILNDRFFHEEKYLSDAYQLPKFPIESSLRNYQLVLVGFKAGRIDVFYLPSSAQTSTSFTSTSSPTSPGTTNSSSYINNLEIKLGDLVIVEADRGRDLGKVFKLNVSIDEARLLKLLQFQEQQAALNEHFDNNFLDDLSVKTMSQQQQQQQSPGTTDSINSFLPSVLSHHQQSSSISPPTLQFPKSVLSIAQPNEIFQILNKKQDEEKACRLCLAKIANATSSCLLSGAPISPTTQDLLQMKLIDSEYQFDRKKLIFYYSTSKRIDFRDLVRELFRIYKTRIWMCAVIGLPFENFKNQNLSPNLIQQQQQHSQQQPPGFGISQQNQQQQQTLFNGGAINNRRLSLQSQPTSQNQINSNLQHHQTWPQEQNSINQQQQFYRPQYQLTPTHSQNLQQPQSYEFQNQNMADLQNTLAPINDENKNNSLLQTPYPDLNQNYYQQQHSLSSEIYTNQFKQQSFNPQLFQPQQQQPPPQTTTTTQQQQQSHNTLSQQDQQAKQKQIEKVHQLAKQHQNKEQSKEEEEIKQDIENNENNDNNSPIELTEENNKKEQQNLSSSSFNSSSYSKNLSNEKLVLKSLVDIIDS